VGEYQKSVSKTYLRPIRFQRLPISALRSGIVKEKTWMIRGWKTREENSRRRISELPGGGKGGGSEGEKKLEKKEGGRRRRSREKKEER
jgi:hypothetical protein